MTAGLFVDGDGTLPAANTRPLGVLYMDTKNGELGTLRVLGIVPAVIGAAVAPDADLQVTAEGKVITRTGSNPIVARALSAGAADGDQIQILLK